MNKRCDGSIENGNGDNEPDYVDGSDVNMSECCLGNYEKYNNMDVGESLKISCE